MGALGGCLALIQLIWDLADLLDDWDFSIGQEVPMAQEKLSPLRVRMIPLGTLLRNIVTARLVPSA